MTDNRIGGITCPVILDAGQVFDACRDRDCFENVRVYLDELGQSIIEHTTKVRTKSAEICGSAISVEPVHLSRGFYRVLVRFFVALEFEACLTGGIGSGVQSFCGIAAVEKSVVLYGGEGGVHVFRSGISDGFCMPVRCGENSNLPTAVVETVNPVILGTEVVEPSDCKICCCCACHEIPESISVKIGNLCDDGRRYLAVSLGFFSVIRMERQGQFLVSAAEYCVPDKECVSVESNSPCDAFRRMAFPTEEFSSRSPSCGPGSISKK